MIRSPVTALLASLLAVGCFSAPPPDPAPPAEAPAPAAAPAVAAAPPARVPGTSSGAAPPRGLQRHDEPGSPFVTAFPTATMSASTTCDDAGCTYVFAVLTAHHEPSLSSRLTFIVPKPALTPEELEARMLGGPDDVFAKHPTWIRHGESPPPPTMKWLKRVITFDDGLEELGKVLVGSAPMGAFLVTEQVHKAELEKARPAFAAVYSHLQLNAANGAPANIPRSAVGTPNAR